MYFFKNGTGWCVRHDPRKKENITRKSQAPIFRKYQATSKYQAPSSASAKRQASQPE